MITTVTGKNQVTIPAYIARQLGIEPGTRLEWLEGDRKGELRVRALPSPTELLRQIREIGVQCAGKTLDSAGVIERMREEDDPVGNAEAPRARGKGA